MQVPASPRKKCAMKMKGEKRWMPKILLMEGRKEFIRCMRNTCVMDIKRF